MTFVGIEPTRGFEAKGFYPFAFFMSIAKC